MPLGRIYMEGIAHKFKEWLDSPSDYCRDEAIPSELIKSTCPVCWDILVDDKCPNGCKPYPLCIKCGEHHEHAITEKV